MKYNLSDIVGTKVRLRPIQMSDTDNIVRWRNNPNVVKNFIFREPFTAEIHTKWMENKVKTGQVVQYIIEDLESGKDVGSVYFRDIDQTHNSAEYGIFLGEDSARGKGIGSETACLFTRFGLENLGFHRISLRVLGGNLQAIRTYEKAGFVQEGIARSMVFLDGRYWDVAFMAIVQE